MYYIGGHIGLGLYNPNVGIHQSGRPNLRVCRLSQSAVIQLQITGAHFIKRGRFSIKTRIVHNYKTVLMKRVRCLPLFSRQGLSKFKGNTLIQNLYNWGKKSFVRLFSASISLRTSTHKEDSLEKLVLTRRILSRN